MLSMCSFGDSENMVISYGCTRAICHLPMADRISIVLWDILGLVFRPKGI